MIWIYSRLIMVRHWFVLKLLEEYPELNDIFNLLAGKIDDAMMQEINYQVDVENRSVKDVASELIEDLGLLD